MRLLLPLASIVCLALCGSWALAADPPKLTAEKALKIANLEAKRNALAADLTGAILQAERLQKQMQEADAAYRSAIEAERTSAKLDPGCKLVENVTWECPAKPTPTPKPSTPEKLEKEKPEKP